MDMFTHPIVIWSDSNPHVIAPTPLHPAKVTVWAGFTSIQTLPSFFFEDTVNGDRYLALLRDHVVSYLRKKRLLSKVT